MEHWGDTGIPSIATGEAKVPASSRILAVTSANIQTYALDVKDGLENQDPFGRDVLDQSDLKYASNHDYPPLGIDHTSRSHQENRQRLNARRNRQHQHYLPNIYADPRRTVLAASQVQTICHPCPTGHWQRWPPGLGLPAGGSFSGLYVSWFWLA